MQRRDLLKRLLFVGATPAVVTPGASMHATPRLDPWTTLDLEFTGVITYGPYRYYWSGLKRNIDHSYLVGQWLACPLNADALDGHHEPYLYVNVPGFVGGAYAPGYTFNLQSNGRFIIDGATSPDQARTWILRGRDHLLQLMERFRTTTARDLPVLPMYNLEGVEIASL